MSTGDEKPKRGRPYAEQTMRQRCYRLLDEEWDLIVEAAALSGDTPSAWLRSWSVRAAKRKINTALRQKQAR